MKFNEVKELLKQFDQSTLTEFNLKENAFELYMNKNQTSKMTVQPLEKVNTEKAEITGEADEKRNLQEEKPASASEVSDSSLLTADMEEIISPLVGVVYLQPAPDKQMFKKVGDKVKKGEVVCIIEAMKLMNDITSTVEGTITEILVENEAVVEYNQPLFRVAKGE